MFDPKLLAELPPAGRRAFRRELVLWSAAFVAHAALWVAVILLPR